MQAPTEKLLSASRAIKIGSSSAKINPRNPESFHMAGLPPSSHEIWRAFRVILTKPWRSRLWAFQEVVVAKADLCLEYHQASEIAYKTSIAYILR